MILSRNYICLEMIQNWNTSVISDFEKVITMNGHLSIPMITIFITINVNRIIPGWAFNSAVSGRFWINWSYFPYPHLITSRNREQIKNCAKQGWDMLENVMYVTKMCHMTQRVFRFCHSEFAISLQEHLGQGMCRACFGSLFSSLPFWLISVIWKLKRWGWGWNVCWGFNGENNMNELSSKFMAKPTWSKTDKQKEKNGEQATDDNEIILKKKRKRT